MESDVLLCSRNSRPQKALVGRAQWKINQTPSLEEVRGGLGRIIYSLVSLRAVKGNLGHSS